MKQELETVRKALDENKAKQAKYFRLYEADSIDPGTLMARLEELKHQHDQLSARHDALRHQIAEGSGPPVELGQVRYLLERFDRFVAAADPSQVKTALQMMIKQIHLDESRQPHSMEIILSEELQQYIGEGPTELRSVGPLLL